MLIVDCDYSIVKVPCQQVNISLEKESVKCIIQGIMWLPALGAAVIWGENKQLKHIVQVSITKKPPLKPEAFL